MIRNIYTYAQLPTFRNDRHVGNWAPRAGIMATICTIILAHGCAKAPQAHSGPALSTMSARRGPGVAARARKVCHRKRYQTQAVIVVIERGCLRRGLSTLVVIVLDPGGRKASEDTVEILRRFFGESMPGLAPLVVTRDPLGRPVFLFVILPNGGSHE